MFVNEIHWNVFETDSKGSKQKCRYYGDVHILRGQEYHNLIHEWFLWGLAVCCP